LGALGQDLKRVAVRCDHCVEDGFDEINRHLLVEEIRHGVDEDQPRPLPFEREVEAVGPEL